MWLFQSNLSLNKSPRNFSSLLKENDTRAQADSWLTDPQTLCFLTVQNQAMRKQAERNQVKKRPWETRLKHFPNSFKVVSSQSFTFQTGKATRISSAYFTINVLLETGTREPMCAAKSWGASTEPCRTPEVTLWKLLYAASCKLMRNCPSLRKDEIQCTKRDGSPHGPECWPEMPDRENQILSEGRKIGL